VFHSIGAWADGDRLQVEGQLTLAGTTRPSAFELTVREDGTLEGRARVVQTAWGIKPFSGLMGTLRIADEVLVEVAGRLP
jgi:polyisoprenoid-binding protein YceI